MDLGHETLVELLAESAPADHAGAQRGQRGSVGGARVCETEDMLWGSVLHTVHASCTALSNTSLFPVVQAVIASSLGTVAPRAALSKSRHWWSTAARSALCSKFGAEAQAVLLQTLPDGVRAFLVTGR